MIDRERDEKKREIDNLFSTALQSNPTALGMELVSCVATANPRDQLELKNYAIRKFSQQLGPILTKKPDQLTEDDNYIQGFLTQASNLFMKEVSEYLDMRPRVAEPKPPEQNPIRFEPKGFDKEFSKLLGSANPAEIFSYLQRVTEMARTDANQQARISYILEKMVTELRNCQNELASDNPNKDIAAIKLRGNLLSNALDLYINMYLKDLDPKLVDNAIKAVSINTKEKTLDDLTAVSNMFMKKFNPPLPDAPMNIQRGRAMLDPIPPVPSPLPSRQRSSTSTSLAALNRSVSFAPPNPPNPDANVAMAPSVRASARALAPDNQQRQSLREGAHPNASLQITTRPKVK